MYIFILFFPVLQSEKLNKGNGIEGSGVSSKAVAKFLEKQRLEKEARKSKFIFISYNL